MNTLHRILWLADWTVLAYLLTLNACYLFLLGLAALDLWAHARAAAYAAYDLAFRDPRTPDVAVLLPAYNEELNIATSLRGTLNLNYPSFEVIVVNDGSTDRTLETLKHALRLAPAERFHDPPLETKAIRQVYRSLEHPQVVVIDKEHGGKADALNAALNASRAPYVCAVDADAILEEDALLRVMRPVLEDPERVVAVGGIVRLVNGCKVRHGRVVQAGLPRRLLPMFQTVEYLRAFLSGRAGFSRLNALLIISGAFGVFSRKWALAAGGYRTDTVGEDMDLVCALHELLRGMGRPYRIAFVGDPVCWTEAPENLRSLAGQRRRWQRGLMESLSRHRGLPRLGGAVGLFAYPFFWAFEGWGPVLETAGYAAFGLSWWMGWLDPAFTLAFLALSFLAGMLLSLSALLLEELSFPRFVGWTDFVRLLLYGVIENLGYRQWNTLVRAHAIVQHLRGTGGWGEMQRRGIATA